MTFKCIALMTVAACCLTSCSSTIPNKKVTSQPDIKAPTKAKPVIKYTIKFEDVTEKMGLKGRTHHATWADLNGDGWTDLVANGKIWKNCQGKKFEDITRKSGLKGRKDPCVIADFNGDGINDLYFIGGGGRYFLGNGDFTFKPGKAFKNPAKSVQAGTAADFNNDGYPDIYVTGYEIWKTQKEYPDLILKNNHGALEKQWMTENKDIFRARGVTSCDFNDDGNVDIYVSNYRLQPNILWVNHGNWKLTNEAREYGCAGTEREKTIFKTGHGKTYCCSGHTIGSLWADFNNDSYFDLFVGNFSHPPKYQDRPQFLENGGPDKKYHFTDRSAIAGIPWQESYCSPTAADVDNDGNIDLFFATIYPRDNSRMFRNLGHWHFSDVTGPSQIKSKQTYQAAFADFDNDGRMDLITQGKLYRNISTTGNWLSIKLSGKSPATTALGAKVFVTCGNKTFSRQVEAGTGNGNQNDLRLHFGLGNFTGKAKIKILWPDGTIQKQESKTDQQLNISQK